MHDMLQAFYDLTVKERDFERHQVDRLTNERDRYKKALEQILGHFIPGRRNTYAPADKTLDMIRAEVEEVLLDV